MKQYISLIFCFFTLVGFSQDKKVHLVHGLGGNSVSWSEFSEDLESVCPGLETTKFFNTSNEGIAVFSQDLIKNFETYGYSSEDVAIGHSFGGINLRNIDDQGYFGGYITVGSVHEGSPLANAKIDGTFEDWVKNSCKEVITDPYVALSDLSLLYLAPDIFDGFFSRAFCNMIYKILLFMSGDFIGDGGSVEDLKVGGAVSSLPAASIPGIGVVCTSEGHPLWTLLDGAEEYKLPIGTYNTNAKILEYSANATSKTLDVLSIFTIDPWTKRKLKKASKECKESYLWLQSMESAWNQLIGAGGTVSYTEIETQNWVCDCYDVNTGQPVPCGTSNSSDQVIINDVDPGATCGSDSSDDCWVTTSFTIPSFGPDLPSDGLVPLNRQSLPGSIHEDLVTNVSHFEEPTNTGIQKLLKAHLHPNFAVSPEFRFQKCL